jgi:hypothetical protein
VQVATADAYFVPAAEVSFIFLQVPHPPIPAPPHMLSAYPTLTDGVPTLDAVALET